MMLIFEHKLDRDSPHPNLPLEVKEPVDGSGLPPLHHHPPFLLMAPTKAAPAKIQVTHSSFHSDEELWNECCFPSKHIG